MRLTELMEIFEGYAPSSLAEEWDNVGLLIEPEEKDIKRVLVALDCTVNIAKEAKEKDVQMLLTHHPIFFKPVKSIFYTNAETAAAYYLIRNGIGLYAAHTNLDNARGGVNDALANAFGLTNVRGGDNNDMPLAMRIGDLHKELTLQELALLAEKKLDTRARIGGDKNKKIEKVAVVGGSGGDFIKEAKQMGADVLITGEIKHSQALEAGVYDIGIIEAGHYETEKLALLSFIDGLQSKHKDIQYNVEFIFAQWDKSPLVAPA